MLADGSTAIDGNATKADRTRWLGQAAETFVSGVCGCGACPSIVLSDAKGRTPGPDCARRVILEAEAADGHLLLFIDDDQLSYLELAPLKDEPVLKFPDLEDTTLAT